MYFCNSFYDTRSKLSSNIHFLFSLPCGILETEYQLVRTLILY